MSNEHSERYNPQKIESRWSKEWAGGFGLFSQPDRLSKGDDSKEKYYVLDMFPYPSGKLHMGHARNYSIGDVLARYYHRKGYRVLHPMGWDAFGLPAENAAIQRGTHPDDWTQVNIGTFKEAMEALGIHYDWEREVNTSKPDYYRWTQFLFLKLYEEGLVYRKESLANWCDSCQTVLANEQVVQGECERCHSVVRQKNLAQWFFKITDYAQELLDSLDDLPDWPEQVRLMQRNWIGRSEGVEFDLAIDDFEEAVSVFTTRVDTVYGMTYVVLAPEHPLVRQLVEGTEKETEVGDFVDKVLAQDRFLRAADETEKEGAFTGRYAVNPVSGRKVPIWVANYVLMEYGTGIVMAVPAHDTRDFAFARKYDLDIIPVIMPEGETLTESTMTDAYAEPGVMANSASFDGQASIEATEGIADMMEREGYGRRKINFRLRDWCISRQRYWGTPIPLIHCDSCGVVPVPDEQLPVELPRIDNYRPKGHSPLAEAVDWMNVPCPKCGKPAKREVDTMDTFVDSSWYFLRYTSLPEDAPFCTEAANEWMPVDTYIGGITHAIMHLMYARFITKALRDVGLLNIDEPFKRLFTQGMVTLGGKAMSKSRGNVVGIDEVADKYGADTGRLFTLFVSPPDKEMEWNIEGVEGIYRFLGRVWRLFDGRWNLNSFDYDVKKLDCVLKELHMMRHKMVKKFTEDIENIHFNTAIAYAMETVNYVYMLETDQYPTQLYIDEISQVLNKSNYKTFQNALYDADSTFVRSWFSPSDLITHESKVKAIRRIVRSHNILPSEIEAITTSLEVALQQPESGKIRAALGIYKGIRQIGSSPLAHTVVAATLRSLTDLLAPFAPFLGEELHMRLDEEQNVKEKDRKSVHDRDWPTWDEAALVVEEITLAVQINGKIRDEITVPAEATADEIIEIALARERVQKYTEGKEIKNRIVVPGRLVSIAVK